MPGPYFPGQQPSSCGHYYPDVLRLRDEKRPGGKFIRILDCQFCGRLELELDPRTLAREVLSEFDPQGIAPGIREDQIDQVRQREFARLAAKGRTQRKPGRKRKR